MTKKEQLIRDYEDLKGKGIECVCLFIHMPTGETEVITNPRVDEKIAYVNKTYNDDLVHGNCDQIYIENYVFSLKEDTFDFGSAIENLKEGHKVARKGWNGKGQYIELASKISYVNASNKLVNAEHDAIGNNAIAFVGTSGVQLGWLASQADMLAEDWQIIQ